MARGSAQRHLRTDLHRPEAQQETRLMDDCLRCHGMHFDGGIRQLVPPVNAKGPWRLVDAELTARPAIPCLALPLACTAKARRRQEGGERVGAKQESCRPVAGLFDRRTRPTFRSHAAAARDAGRRAAGEDESGPAPGAMLSVPRAARIHAGRERRRPHADRRPRGHQLSGVPPEARPEHAAVLCGLPPAAVELRSRRREDGHHVRESEEQA